MLGNRMATRCGSWRKQTNVKQQSRWCQNHVTSWQLRCRVAGGSPLTGLVTTTLTAVTLGWLSQCRFWHISSFTASRGRLACFTTSSGRSSPEVAALYPSSRRSTPLSCTAQVCTEGVMASGLTLFVIWFEYTNNIPLFRTRSTLTTITTLWSGLIIFRPHNLTPI